MAVWQILFRWTKYFVAFVYILLWGLALLNNNSRVSYTMPEIFYTAAMRPAPRSNVSRNLHKDYCRLRWDDLQLQRLDVFDKRPMSDLVAENPEVKPGGIWTPTDCIPFQQVAIVIPYRDRMQHLKLLLRRLHPMLRRQKVDYQIFVIEQGGTTRFNRGMLMNVGVNEALKRGKFDCFIFHDVDLIPEHDRNIYLCDDYARHLSSAIDEMRYHVMFYNYAGGVIALTRENVFKINGYPNIYWGWGNEDDDFSARTMVAGLKLTRPPEHIGRYKMVKHMKADRNDDGYPLFMGFRGRQYYDGLNSLTPQSYRVEGVKMEPLYTRITVDLIRPEPLIDPKWPKTEETWVWFLRFYGWL